MIWAIYRIHYGIDFIKQSINSIIDDVDKVFIFYSLDPWIKSKELKYRGRIINFPKNPESVEIFLKKKSLIKRLLYKIMNAQLHLINLGHYLQKLVI